MVYAISRRQTSPQLRLDRITITAALLLPIYIAFQLLPFPLCVLQFLSSTRSDLTYAAGMIMPLARSAPLSINPSITVLHLYRIGAYALIFLLVRDMTLKSANNTWATAMPLMAIGALEAGWGLWQYSSGVHAVTGTYVDRDLFSGLVEMALPLILMYGFAVLYRGRERGRFAVPAALKACAIWLMAAGALLAVVFSFSKAGFFATLSSLFVMGVVGLASGLSRWKTLSTLAVLSIVVLLGLIFLPPNELVAQLGGVASDPTGEGRFPIWKDTLRLIAAYPLFGCGFGNYSPGLSRYQTAGLSGGWPWAHNDYLQVLSEMGLIGFLIPATLMMGVILGALRAAIAAGARETRYLALACTGSVIAILIHCIAQFHMYIAANAMVLSWISGIAAGLPMLNQCEERQSRILSSSSLTKFLFFLSCLVVVCAGSRLAFLHVVSGNPQAERLFCRFGICDTDGALAELRRTSGDADVAAVPRVELVEFVRRDPAGPARWCDLGEAYQKAGQTDRARYCFSRAVVLGPNLPYILFRAGRFQLSLGEHRKAVQLMAHAQQGDPAYDQLIFSSYEQRRIPADEIVKFGLRDLRTHQKYLRVLIAEKKKLDAETVWTSILSRGYADDKLANEYIAFQIQNKNPEAAAQAWAQYAGARSKGYPESNLIFNAGLESDPTASRFDWTIEQTRGAKINFDPKILHSGTRSLRILFDGTQNLSSLGLHQTVFLKPGRYRFQAYVRTQDISTDEGISFRVSSEQPPNRLSFTTEPLLGSTDWKLVQHAFVVPPGTGLAEIRLVRTPSQRFDNLIRGTLWIDDVSITPDPVR